jgi:hypothetical protein
LQVTRDDAGLLVVTGGVTGQLEDLSGQVLHDGSQVDGGTKLDETVSRSRMTKLW